FVVEPGNLLVDSVGGPIGDGPVGGSRGAGFVRHARRELLLQTERDVKRGSMEPAPEVDGVREPGQRPGGLQEDFLGRILGVLSVAEDLVAEVVDAVLRVAEERGQGLAAGRGLVGVESIHQGYSRRRSSLLTDFLKLTTKAPFVVFVPLC